MFTLGELIIIEIATLSFIKDLDLSLQAGQEFMEILGKCEKSIQQLRAAAANTGPMNLGPGPQDPQPK